MPSRERVQALISYVEQRREVEAIREFYAVDAQTQENNAPPTVGLAALIEKEQGFVGSSRVDLQACKLEYSIVSPK